MSSFLKRTDAFSNLRIMSLLIFYFKFIVSLFAPVYLRSWKKKKLPERASNLHPRFMRNNIVINSCNRRDYIRVGLFRFAPDCSRMSATSATLAAVYVVESKHRRQKGKPARKGRRVYATKSDSSSSSRLHRRMSFNSSRDAVRLHLRKPACSECLLWRSLRGSQLSLIIADGCYYAAFRN